MRHDTVKERQSGFVHFCEGIFRHCPQDEHERNELIIHSQSLQSLQGFPGVGGLPGPKGAKGNLTIATEKGPKVTINYNKKSQDGIFEKFYYFSHACDM